MINQPILRSALHAGVVQVTFTKVNGDERIMSCTLKSDLLPVVVVAEAVEGEEVVVKQTKKPNPDVLAEFDVKAEGWRSFRWESVKSYTLEQ